MESIHSRLNKAFQLIQEADYIIIGAGAGLSAAAGFDYSGKRFNEIFSDFKDKYGIEDMYSGSFYPFSSEEEKWAYWARFVKCNTFDTKPTPLYQKLLRLIQDKDYFVVTTNTDNQFEINGFNMSRYFETQGNFKYFQCQKGCHRKVYQDQKLIQFMVQQTKDCKIPTSLVPKCPYCHGNMDIHVRKNAYFVETKGWEHYCRNYERFLKKALKRKVVFLEFGVGFNTPSIIRYPFERMTYQHKNCSLIRFNKDYPFIIKGIENRMIAFDENIEDILTHLLEVKENERKRTFKTHERKTLLSSI